MKGQAIVLQLVGVVVAVASACLTLVALGLLCLEIFLTLFGMQQRSLSGALLWVPLVMIALIWVLGGTMSRYTRSLRNSPEDSPSDSPESTRTPYVLAVLSSIPLLALCAWMLFRTGWLRSWTP